MAYKLLGSAGLAQLIVEMLELMETAAAGAAVSYKRTFTAGEWTADGSGVKLVIPAAEHGLSGPVVVGTIYAAGGGTLSPTLWCARETSYSLDSNGNLVLRCPDSAGYAGACAFV